MEEKTPIIVQQTFDVSIETVWKAITDLGQMQQWYFTNVPDFKPEIGFETRFLIQNEGRNFTHIWKVTEVIPKKSISYSWTFKEYSGEALSTFALEENGSKTTLILKSQVLIKFPDDIPEFKRESGQAGWDYLIKQRLKNFLEA